MALSSFVDACFSTRIGVQRQPASDSHTALARSDDGGRHWSGDRRRCRTISSIPDLTLLADGTILTVNWPPQQEDPEDTSSLWASTDRGDSWRPLSKLQGIVPNQALAPFGATSANATAERPLYLSAASYVVSRMLYLKAAEIVDDRHWAYLPPLPVKGAEQQTTSASPASSA